MRKLRGSGDLKFVRGELMCNRTITTHGGYHEEVKGVSPCYSAVGPD